MQINLKRHLIYGASGSFALKLTAIMASMGVAVVLARVLGPKNFGLYTFCISIISVLIVPATMGMPTIVLRELAVYRLQYCFLVLPLLLSLWLLLYLVPCQGINVGLLLVI